MGKQTTGGFEKYGQFRLYVNTSNIGVGGIPFQVEEGTERLLAYYSKRLEDNCKSLSITKLEMKGITVCVFEFKHMLKSAEVEIYCDHRAIPHIMKSTKEVPT